MSQPVDFLGTPIVVGDEVVFVQLRYRNLMKGVIKKITPKMVIISHKKTNLGDIESKQYHNQIIKIKED